MEQALVTRQSSRKLGPLVIYALAEIRPVLIFPKFHHQDVINLTFSYTL